ncbi:Isovaleryl-homoserine lactone synthase [Roseivivax sp. THAF30]|nr:Isovaleryl-homoserine lactone synthase [Roseivivax sp. THAF30]
MSFQERKADIAFPELEPELPSERKTRNPAFLRNVGSKVLLAQHPRLKTSVISVHNQHLHGELYLEFLRARKRVFIEQKKWDLPFEKDLEFDQYDTPQSRCVIIHEFGEVLGGLRLLPTTARCACYTYMIRDAQRGLLPDIPDYILYEKAPVADHIWEGTRLFVSQDISAERRVGVQTRLMLAMAETAVEAGATHVIGLVPALYQRWVARLGIGALPLGPKMNIDGENTQAAVMHVAAVAKNGKTHH